MPDVVVVDSIRPRIPTMPTEQPNPSSEIRRDNPTSSPSVEPIIIDSIRPIPELEDDSG
jgi:hypothetical protein